MIEVLIALALLGIGFWLGSRKPLPAVQLQPAEQEQRLLQEERAAFAQLMGYNADRAYGLQEDGEEDVYGV